MHKDSKRIILASVIIIILGLFFSIYIVLNDISTSKADLVDLSSPETTISSLQKALEEQSFVMLDRIFEETHYSPVFGELFFGKHTRVRYGFSNDDDVNRKRAVTSLDFKKVEIGKLKMLNEQAGLGLLMIDAINPYPQYDEPEIIKNLLNVAFLIQKRDGEWKITKLYDFIYIDSEFLEVRDFKLHYIDNTFFLELKHKQFEHNIQSTLLYNFALTIERIEIGTDRTILCTLNRSNVRAFGQGIEFKLKDDSLHNPEYLQIEGKCGFDSIITKDTEKKHLIYINIKTSDRIVPLVYYGDLVL
jgi:hypothetical protein